MSDYSEETIEEVLACYAEYGSGEASRQYNVTPRTIVRWARRRGIRSGWNRQPATEPSHGTTALYWDGCRCDDCRASNTAYTRASRAKHGWRTCPCPLCVYARLAFTTGVRAQDYYTDPDVEPLSPNGRELHAMAAERYATKKAPAEDPWGLPFVDSCRPEWQLDAICRGKSHLYFTDVGEPGRRLTGEQQKQVRAAKAEAQALCMGCPVRTECLRYALENHERFDIWGGLTARQRRGLTPADLDRKVSA